MFNAKPASLRWFSQSTENELTGFEPLLWSSPTVSYGVRANMGAKPLYQNYMNEGSILSDANGGRS